MKSSGLKLAQVLLVAVFGIAPLLPACTADAACAMPCCSQGAHHAAGATAPLPDPECCPAPGLPPRHIAEGCGAGPRDLDVHPGVSGAFLPVALSPGEALVGTPAAPDLNTGILAGLLPLSGKTPLYLRVRTLRI